MRSYTKVIFAALLATLIMSATAGVASANRSLSLNNGGTRTFEYAGRYTFTEEGGGFSVICRVLRRITFSADTIVKTAGTVVGTAVIAISECTGGNIRILQTTAWRIRLDGFTGTLPTIRTLRITIEPNRGGLLWEVFFGIARCLYGANMPGIANINAAGEVTEIVAEESPNVPTVNLGGVECPTSLLRGLLRPLERTPAIRLRLV